jgi:hypothetical protein
MWPEGFEKTFLFAQLVLTYCTVICELKVHVYV